MLKFSSKSTVRQKDRGQKHILSQIASVGREITLSTGIHWREGKMIPIFNGRKTHRYTHISQYAFFMEYGTRNKSGGWHSPPRPFMTISYNASKTKMELMGIDGLKRVYTGRGTFMGMMETSGRFQREYIKGTIRLLNYPPNSDYVTRKKQIFGKLQTPLIYTGAMHNAVTHRVGVSKARNMVKRSIEKIDDLITEASLWQ